MSVGSAVEVAVMALFVGWCMGVLTGVFCLVLIERQDRKNRTRVPLTADSPPGHTEPHDGNLRSGEGE